MIRSHQVGFIAAVAAASMALSSSALAQPEEILAPGSQPASAPSRALPPPLPPPKQKPPRRKSPKRLAFEKEKFEDYRTGRSIRTAGILITVVAGGAAILSAGFGGFLYLLCAGSECDTSVSHKFLIFGAVSAGVALGLGVPLWIGGHIKVKNTLNRRMTKLGIPRVGVAALPGGATFSASWRF